MTCLVQMHSTIEHLLDRFKKNPDAPAQKAADSMSGRPASAAASYGSMPGYGGAASFSLQVRACHHKPERQRLAWRHGHVCTALLFDSASMSDCSTLRLRIAAEMPMSNELLDGCGEQELQLGTAQGYTLTPFVWLALQGYEQPGLPSQYTYASQYGSTFVPAGGGAGAMQPLAVPGYYGKASCSVQTELPSMYWCCCTS